MKRFNLQKVFYTVVIILSVIIFTPTIYSQETTNLPSEARYAPDSFIVKYKKAQSPLAFQAEAERREEAARSIMGRISILQENISLAIQGQDTPEEKAEKFFLLNENTGVVEVEPLERKNDETLLYQTDSTKSIAALVTLFQSQEEVEYAEPNYLYEFFNTPNDTDFDKLWGLKKINADRAWDKQTGSKTVIVADVDSGVDDNHPDLKDNILEVKSFTPCAAGGDQLGHGTHTAGIIGAVGNNTTGVVGVNWSVGLLVLKVGCTSDDITLASIIEATDYALTKNAKIINMSLGGSSCSRALSDSIANAVQHGTVVVAAAGNSGQEDSDRLCPASDPNVITVSATGPEDELAAYSSWGNAVDVSAPGGNGDRTIGCTSSRCILSTWPQTKYAAAHGTSMSAPHVTGLVALMFAVKSQLTPQEVKKILEATAVDLGQPGRDNQFGAGRIDAAAAIDNLTGNSNPSPTIEPTTPIENHPTYEPTIKPDSITIKPTRGSDCASASNDGDIDCNGAVTRGDLDHWKTIFEPGRGMLNLLERWREAFFKLTGVS